MSANGGPARLLRVYGLWILLVTVVVMAAAYGVSMLAPTAYRSAAIVVVEARVRPNTTPLQPEMGTEKELARSGLVVRPAAKALGVDPATLGDGLTVSVAPDANVLTFAYDAADPVTAQTQAQALAQAYVDYRNGATSSTSPAARSAATSTASLHATLVTPAYLPSVPVARPVWIDLGIGLILGLLLGVGTALVRDRMSDRVRGRDDFERISGVTVLATVPRTRRPRGADADRPVLLRAPESPAAESYRYLRSRLQPLLGPGEATILVASAHEGEGRSTTAANLALALALAGRDVILVDADLRRPRLHTLFGVPDADGLTSLLTGDSLLADTLQDGPVPRLRLITAGPGADAAADLLESPRLASVLRAVRRQCDVVVLDSAAVLSVSDAIALAAVSDHVLLVGDYRRTTRGALARALTELGEVVHGNVSGVLVNAPKSAGGLVPLARGGAIPAGAPAGVPGPLPLLDTGDDPAGVDPAVAAFGSAAVPKAVAAKAAVPGSTVYTSASATPLTAPGDPGPQPGDAGRRQAPGDALPRRAPVLPEPRRAPVHPEPPRVPGASEPRQMPVGSEPPRVPGGPEPRHMPVGSEPLRVSGGSDYRSGAPMNAPVNGSHPAARTPNPTAGPVKARINGLQRRPDGMQRRPDAAQGRTDDPRGRAGGMQPRPDAAQGRIDEARGRADEVHGRADEVHGRADGMRGRPDGGADGIAVPSPRGGDAERSLEPRG
jgi:succinoglycan biosynthesis transport protein ExoP